MSASFQTHAVTISGDLSGLTRTLLQEIHRQSHEVVKQTAITRTPVGSGRDPHPGLMKRSWRDLPSPPESAIAQMQPTKVENQAPHALIVDRGRRMSGAYRTRAGAGTELVPTNRRRKDGSVVMRRRAKSRVSKPRLLGSTQAPLGVKGQALRELRAQQEAILARAKAAVESKGTR